MCVVEEGRRGPRVLYTELLRLRGARLRLGGHLARVPSHAHLQPITSSPERAIGLVGGGVEKGLHGLELREAGLKQADLWEDWLSWRVLREPCGERGQERVGLTLLATPLRVLGGAVAHGWKAQLTWNLVTSTSKEPSPLVCPGEAVWDLRNNREERDCLSQDPRRHRS